MINRLSRSLAGMIIVVTIFISMATAVNADSCNLTIALKPHDGLGSVNNVKFLFYKVGDVDTKTDKPIFDAKYGIAEPPQTAEEVLADIEVIKKANKSSPVTTGTTSSDGILDKTLDRGIYYIEAEKNDYGTIEPMLIWLPYFDDITGDLVYSLTIEPKAGKVAAEVADPTTTAVTPGKVEGQVAGETANEAKTNDSFTFMTYIGILLLSAVVLTTIFISRKKEKSHDR